MSERSGLHPKPTLPLSRRCRQTTYHTKGNMNLNITKKDVQSIRRIIRHIHTSDPTIQKEVLRIDALLEQLLKPKEQK